jgi:hypothetical protein
LVTPEAILASGGAEALAHPYVHGPCVTVEADAGRASRRPLVRAQAHPRTDADPQGE